VPGDTVSATFSESTPLSEALQSNFFQGISRPLPHGVTVTGEPAAVVCAGLGLDCEQGSLGGSFVRLFESRCWEVIIGQGCDGMPGWWWGGCTSSFQSARRTYGAADGVLGW
jgi:hypothetical protein